MGQIAIGGIYLGLNAGAVGLATAKAATNWWQAGGAGGAVQVLQAISAASYAASKLDLSGNSNNASNGSSFPTWDTTNGWTFNGSDQYLDTNVVPTIDGTWTVLIRYVYAGGGFFPCVFGVRPDAGANDFVVVVDNSSDGSSDTTVARNGSVTGVSHSPRLGSGVIGVVGNKLFLDGAQVDTITTGSVANTYSIYMACLNAQGVPFVFFPGTVQAYALYNNTLSDAEVSAVSAAMALL